MGTKSDRKGEEPIMEARNHDSDFYDSDDGCSLLSNFDVDERLLIEQLEEEISNQDIHRLGCQDVDANLDGVAQLFTVARTIRRWKISWVLIRSVLIHLTIQEHFGGPSTSLLSNPINCSISSQLSV